VGRRAREAEAEALEDEARALELELELAEVEGRAPRGDEAWSGDGYREAQRETMAAREADTGEGISRQELRDRGYRSVSKHSDLLPYGYQIIVWFSPAEERTLYEYAPYPVKQIHHLERELVRRTAETFDEQQAVHDAIGVADSEVCDTQGELF
jgi:hypothetical protein